MYVLIYVYAYMIMSVRADEYADMYADMYIDDCVIRIRTTREQEMEYHSPSSNEHG